MTAAQNFLGSSKLSPNLRPSSPASSRKSVSPALQKRAAMFGGLHERSQSEDGASIRSGSPVQSLRAQSPINSLRSQGSSRSDIASLRSSLKPATRPGHQRQQSKTSLTSSVSQYAEEVPRPLVIIQPPLPKKAVETTAHPRLPVPSSPGPAQSMMSGMSSISSVPDAQVRNPCKASTACADLVYAS